MKKMLTRLARTGAASVALAFAGFAAFAVSGASAHASEGVALDRAPDNAANLASLQHGAQLFSTYCLSCHSANLMRYSRLTDLGLSRTAIEAKFLFAGHKIGDTMTIAMRPDDAKSWFGATPPDLSVEARARGRDWLYTYLRGFYRDASRPTGWNNTVYQNVSMPNVLWTLQGQRIAKFDDTVDQKTGERSHEFAGFQQMAPGTLSPAAYDAAVGDIVAYLSWMSEPEQQTRKRVGVWVLLFLGGLTLLAWRLNAAYWKDIE